MTRPINTPTTMTTTPSPPDWRGLCEELVEALDTCRLELTEDRLLLERIRTALAQPEPAADPLAQFISECRPLDDETAALLTPDVRWHLYDESGSPSPCR